MTNDSIKLTSEDMNIWELFLVRARYRDTQRVKLEPKQRIWLNNPDEVYIIYQGIAHIFIADLDENGAAGARQFLFSAGTGNLLFGIYTAHHQKAVILDGAPGTDFLKMSLSDFRDLADERDELAQVVALMVDRWLSRLPKALRVEAAPKDFISAGDVHQLEAGDVLRYLQGAIWVRLKSGSAMIMGNESQILGPEDGLVPLMKQSWFTFRAPSEVEYASTYDLLKDGSLIERLQHIHRNNFDFIARRMDQAEADEHLRLQRKHADDDRRLAQALNDVAGVLSQASGATVPYSDTQDPFFMAAEKVAAYEGIQLVQPAEYQVRQSFQRPLIEIARASRVRTRRVSLRGEWWRQDNGALLGFMKADDTPVALLPTSPSSYEMLNPQTGERTPITDEVAYTLSYFAHTFYRRFADQAITAMEMLRFGLRDVRRDMRMILLVGSLVGILQIANPIVTQFIFDDIIPAGDRSLLLQIGGALVGIAVAIALLTIVQGAAIIRIESKAEGSIQPALWDRLLELPVSFFRDYTAGDLGTRAMGISVMRGIISGMTAMSIISGVFSIFNLFLMLYYSLTLGLIALGLVLLAMLITAYAGYANVKIQRSVSDFQGKLAGYMLQFINGIAKFRVAEAEDRIFSFWAKKYSQQRQATFRARMVENRLQIFLAAFPAISLLVLFWALGRGNIDLTVGTFLAFNTAYTQFLGAALQLSGAIVVILAIVPLYERAKPILDTLPEINNDKTPPPELEGHIEVVGLSFRYTEDGPLALHDVSFTVERGQFVALVGASGSGKSTIMRLLLGFEAPETGAVYYDGLDLDDLDVRGVRRQIGVVLQNSKLMSGSDIYTNIIGATTLTMEDAWQAAENSGFAPDIREMPMGMHTVVAEGGGTLSGGQRQRLLIARAIVNKPRLLFFDEATSALDNRTQAIVSESLEKLDTTRLVIAHRLSTIMNADKIIVMDKGRIVQQGTYTELMQQGGPFADLAARQLT
ncbi:MAG: NHLP bacteriocin export ABC transporter permease/ATPase subunit [Anaerolineales bacterium]